MATTEAQAKRVGLTTRSMLKKRSIACLYIHLVGDFKSQLKPHSGGPCCRRRYSTYTAAILTFRVNSSHE